MRMGWMVGAALAVACAAGAQTTKVFYDTTGGAENGGDTFGTAGNILLDEVGPRLAKYKLDSVVLNVRLKHADTGSFDVVYAIRSLNGKPTKKKVIATVQDSQLSTSFQLITVPGGGATFLKYKRYYIGIAKHKGVPSSVVFGNTVDPAVLARKSVQEGGYYYNSGGVQANAGGPYEMQVNVSLK